MTTRVDVTVQDATTQAVVVHKRGDTQIGHNTVLGQQDGPVTTHFLVAAGETLTITEEAQPEPEVVEAEAEPAADLA